MAAFSPWPATLLFAVNHLLRQAPWARAQLAGHAHKQAQFVLPLGGVHFVVSDEGLLQAVSAPVQAANMAGDMQAGVAAVDVRVILRTPQPFSLEIERWLDTAHVEGNAAFATTLSFVLKNLRWDVEETLAEGVGDILAHRLVATGRQLWHAQREGAQRLFARAGAYISAEQGWLVSRYEHTTFADELTALIARLHALECHLGGPLVLAGQDKTADAGKN